MLVGIANQRSSNVHGLFVMTAATVVVVFISTYFQHSAQFAKPYNWIVLSFTYMIIAYAGYPYPTPGSDFDIGLGWQLAGLRAFHVFIGDLWALLFSLIFWTRSADTFARGMIGIYKVRLK